eukprot:14643760-Alexandrium_andersonii.AAC.1
MAQRLRLTWSQIEQHGSREFACSHREEYVFSPVFMAANTASTLYQALDSAMEHMSFAGLQALSTQVRVVVVSLVSDLDSANV